MPGESASRTEIATPWTSGRLKTSSIRWICCAGSGSGRRISTWAPNSRPASFIPCSTAFHQSELPLVMKIKRGSEPPDEAELAAGAVPAAPSPEPPPQPIVAKKLKKRALDANRRIFENVTVNLPGDFRGPRWTGLYHNRETTMKKRLAHDRKA